jgi:hypothetical protein
MYWDFSKTMLTSLLVVTFALIGTSAVLMNTIAHDPNYWWTVYMWAPVFLLLLLVVVVRTMRTFRKLAVKVDGYLKKVEAGEKIPDLQELLDLEKTGRWGRLLMGKKPKSDK